MERTVSGWPAVGDAKRGKCRWVWILYVVHKVNDFSSSRKVGRGGDAKWG